MKQIIATAAIATSFIMLSCGKNANQSESTSDVLAKGDPGEPGN